MTMNVQVSMGCTPQCSQHNSPYRRAASPLPTTGRRWRARPDVDALYSIFRGRNILEWDYETLRGKLRPLLIEWDMRQGPRPPRESG